MTRPVMPLRVQRGRAEEDRRDAVMAALVALVRKYDEHKARGWERMALGALAPVVEAYRGDLLAPEPGSLAARLMDIDRKEET